MTPIQPVHKKDHGAAVAALHAGLLFLVRNQGGLSDNDRRTLEQGLAAELRDQAYGNWTAHLVSLWQEQLADRFQLFVNGNVDPATASALNALIAELGAPSENPPPVEIGPLTPIQAMVRGAQGAAVAALHAGLLFLIRNQGGISAHDRLILEQGLASELRGLGGALTGLLGQMTVRAPVAGARREERLRERMTALLAGTSLDEARIATEVAVWATKTDVTEELARLRVHLEEFGLMLDKGGSIGRQLDFLIQEMNREVNTVASKADDLELSQAALAAKGVLEKIREQVQNLE